MTRTNRVLAELLDYRLTCAVLTWFVHCVSCYRTHWSKSQVSDKASICVCLHHKLHDGSVIKLCGPLNLHQAEASKPKSEAQKRAEAAAAAAVAAAAEQAAAAQRAVEEQAGEFCNDSCMRRYPRVVSTACRGQRCPVVKRGTCAERFKRCSHSLKSW